MTDTTVQVQVELDVPVPMRDGTVLRANVYRPAGAGRWPVLLTRLPYGKDFPVGAALLDPVQAVRRGYVVVVQDTRGCGRSEGEWYPFLAEAQDGVDTIAWAAGQPYSDGQVGMYGASYFGFTQWAAAVEQPLALRAIVPFETWADPLDGLFGRGGARELGCAANWLLGMGMGVLFRRHADDLAALGPAVAALCTEIDRLGPEGYWSLPLADFGPLRRQPHSPGFFETVTAPLDLSVPLFAATTVHGRQQAVSAPALNIGGWYDLFLGGTLANFQAMHSQGKPSKLLIGPWSHEAQSNPVGELNFGMGSQRGLIDLQGDLDALQLRWFDHWLKGIDTGMLDEAPIKIFVMGANRWRDEYEWPLARANNVPFYLHAGERLGPDLPGDEVPDQYVYDPAQPVPVRGGATLLTPEFPAGAFDQAAIEARPDVLIYSTPPLAEDLEVTGPLVVHLWATSTAPDTDFVARLTDVYPDGRSIVLADGIVRARYRNRARGGPPSLILPGVPYAYAIDLWATSNVFQAGHHIRLQITSSCFPRWDRNPNTGEQTGHDDRMVTAQQTILHDAAHPSHIVLPVVAR